jgi:hypothetical protein
MPKVTYTTSLSIPAFIGIRQQDNDNAINTDMRYATDALNVSTRDGYLAPMASPKFSNGPDVTHFGTAVLFSMRYASTNKEKIVISSGGNLYYKNSAGSEWIRISVEDEDPEDPTIFIDDRWSTLQYEINEEGSSGPVDVLIMSNGFDGMIMVRGDTMTASRVNTPYNFRTIERYGERIWGTSIYEQPDLLVYSAPYDPTDWSANTEHPEDGAGEIRVPSWDGDEFSALKVFGDQLLAFKKHHFWKITGLDPGEYEIKEQFGCGTIFDETIVADIDRMYMLTEDGISVYDGMTVRPYQQEAMRNVWRKYLYAPNTISNSKWYPKGYIFDGKYYIALRVEGYLYFISIDLDTGGWMIRKVAPGTLVEASFLKCGITKDNKFIRVVVGNYLNTTPSASVRICNILDSTMDQRATGYLEGMNSVEPFYWQTPWTDLGSPDVLKSDFEIYFWGERFYANPFEPTTPTQRGPLNVQLKIIVETERGRKEREFQLKDGKNHMHFHIFGRKVRFRLESNWKDNNGNPTTSESSFRIMPGLTINADVHPD